MSAVNGRGRPPSRPAPPPPDDRLPPQNLEAERGVLGSVLLDPEALHDVAPVLGVEDFWRDDHQTVYRAVRDLYAGGGRVDSVTLAEELAMRGELDRVGGVEFLVSLANGVPHAANARYYADIVKQKSVTREVMAKATEILQDGYSNNYTSEQLLERWQAAAMQLSDRTVGDETAIISDAVDDAVARLSRRDGTPSGLTTGWHAFDQMGDGLQGGQLVVLAARPSMGKAQPLDALVLTPDGFDTMASICVGDAVIGSNGKPCKVIGVYPQGELPVYEVTTSDGGSTECCEDHLWFTQTHNERRRGCPGSVKTLKVIMRTLERPSGSSPDHAIPVVGPVEFQNLGEPDIHPYALGLLLGDGGLTGHCPMFHNPETDLVSKLSELVSPDRVVRQGDTISHRVVRGEGGGRSRTKIAIAAVGLDGAGSKQKFIPIHFLYAPVAARLDLLRGLMDTDGFVTDSGQSVEYTTSSPSLARDVMFLARSLGGVVSITTRVPAYTYKGESRLGAESHRMVLSFPRGLVPVSSSKHLAKWKGDHFRNHRTIVSVEPRGFKSCQCIKVDADDQLYITDDFIVTHNTALAMNMIDRFAVELRVPTLFFNMEMSKADLGERMLVTRSGVFNTKFKNPTLLNETDFDWVERARTQLRGAKLYVNDVSNRSVMQVSALTRRYHKRHGVRCLVVDYLQLLAPDNDRDGRQEQVAKMSRGLKNLARDLDIPVIALSQLSRAVESREDRKPRMADLRESGAIEQDADMVVLIHRPDYYKDGDRPGQVDLMVAKNRNGPTGTVTLNWSGALYKFSDGVTPDAGGDPGAPY